MANETPGVRDARYRLLGLQSVPHGDGIVVSRGSKRVFVRGTGVGELLDLLVQRSAEGLGIRLDDLKTEVDPLKLRTLEALIEALRAERFLVETEGDSGTASQPERREEVFYWSHRTTLEAVSANLAGIGLAVFGVNHISLPLLGNLRSVGFRNFDFIDHPALRNLDFYGADGNMRPEIASALSTRPRSFDEWTASGDKPDCTIVCSDVGGLGLMRDWNRTCVAAHALFYPIVLSDEVAHLGPLVVPGEGPCYECLWARRNANLGQGVLDHATDAHAFFGQRVVGYLQPMARVAADLAAIDLLKYFSRALPGGRAGRLIEADLLAPSLTVRNVLKAPRCPVCSRLSPAPAASHSGSA